MKNKVIIAALYVAIFVFLTSASLIDSLNFMPEMIAMAISGGYIVLFDYANSRG